MWLTKEQIEANLKKRQETQYKFLQKVKTKQNSFKKEPPKKVLMYQDYLKKAKAKGDIDQADYNESLYLSSRYREKDVI
jgi:arginine utilization protein RocB